MLLEDSGSAIIDDEGSSGTTGLPPDDLSSPHPIRKTNVSNKLILGTFISALLFWPYN